VAKKVAFTTLGCKANWADTEAISQALASAGFEIVPFDSEADAYVVNTCTVTAIANAQSRQMLRRARSRSAGALVVAAGCYVEVDRAEVSRIRGVDAVFGSSDRAGLIEFLCEKLGGDASHSGELAGPLGPLPLGAQSRARAFLKIQDGCNRRCAYCIIPQARGRSRSLPLEDVLAACRRLSQGHREILLAGIDVGQYGRDLPARPSLSDLVSRLAGCEGMARLRISSLDPNQVDDTLIDLIANSPVLCRHVHLSIQSGSDATLARMSRGYRARDIARVTRALHARVSGIAITGDIIAGFPGEAEEEHDRTVKLIRSIPIAGLHVFPFSARSGTRAAAMPGQVSPHVKKRRASELRGLATDARRIFLKSLINEAFDVILTSRAPDADGFVTAVADNAVKIRLEPGSCAYAQMARAIVTAAVDLEVKGRWA